MNLPFLRENHQNDVTSRDPRTTWSGDLPVRIGPRFSKFWWSEIFLGPGSVPDFEIFLGPCPGWSQVLNFFSVLVRSQVLIFSVLVRFGPWFVKLSLVNSRTFTNSPYIWFSPFSEKLAISIMAIFMKNFKIMHKVNS